MVPRHAADPGGAALTGATALDSPAAILVVDDNPGKRLSIVSVLEPLGHAIVEADSGEAALRAAMRQSFAVVLMDVQMPEMDGYETAGLIRMRAEYEHTPIIFITAHSTEDAKIRAAYASGAVDFISAPIVPDILRAKVSIFVELFLKSRELERSVGEFRDSEARTRSVLENVADGIVTVSGDGVIQSFNRAAAELFGYSEEEAIGKSFSMMVGPKYPADYSSDPDTKRQPWSPQLSSDRAAESVGRRKDGTTFPMELDLSDVELQTGRIHIGCLRDISERQTYTDALQYQALHDNLTGLPNRVLFGDRVAQAIRAALRTGESLALLVMDLDDFKQVNDTLGHHHGDELLKLVTERLVGCLRTGDTVARLGGDEFGVLPRDGTDLAGAATVVWKIQQALEPSFLVNGHAVNVEASIGITLVPDHGDNRDDLLRRADLAMYDAKRTGTGYALFAAEQEETPARRLELLGDLRRCIERDELVLHYQPKIDLSTQETVGVEALLRWNHPSGTLFMPDAFMPEVERSELMIPMTEWVINAALADLTKWRQAGYDLTMAVNIGARCLAEGTRDVRRDPTPHGPLGRSGGPAHARAHRERADRHRRARHARAAPRHERAALDRRLRHRLLVARLPPAAPGRRDQGRPLVRDEHVFGQGRRGHRPVDHRPRAQPRGEGGRRGSGGRGDDEPAQRLWVRRGPGLPLQPPGRERRAVGVARDVAVRIAAAAEGRAA